MMIRRLVASVLVACALAGCGATGSPLAARVQASGVRAAGAEDPVGAGGMGLATRLKRLYGDVFALYDDNEDGIWRPGDFDLPEDRFLNLFHNEDADDDREVTKAEFYTADEHADLVLYVQARAGVTAHALGGRVTFDKAFDVLDVYLQPYLNKDDRKTFIKRAFQTADADGTKYLKTPELEVAYAILLAKAEEKRIEKSVNRSKGQPDAPIHIDPPGWVKKPARP